MVARFFNRPSVCERGPETPPTMNQRNPQLSERMEYSLYLFGLPTIHLLTHSLPTDVSPLVDQAFGLPVINAAAHEWSTLVTALYQLSRVNDIVTGPDSKLVATMDVQEGTEA